MKMKKGHITNESFRFNRRQKRTHAVAAKTFLVQSALLIGMTAGQAHGIAASVAICAICVGGTSDWN